MLTSFRVGDAELLVQPLVPNFWKHPNNNQWGSRFPETHGIWKTAAAERRLKSLVASEVAGQPVLTAEFDLPTVEATYRLQYTFGPAGQISVLAAYQPGSRKLPSLPRFGMQLAVPEKLSQVAYYGRGPQETYEDRKTGGELGIYQNIVVDLNHSYIRPQDVGNRSDVRWFSLLSPTGGGLKVLGPQPLSMSVWPFSLADLEAATHAYQLPRRDFNVVHIDWKLHGVGGDNSWGALTHPEYTLPANQPYEFEFLLQPITAP